MLEFLHHVAYRLYLITGTEQDAEQYDYRTHHYAQ